MNNFFLSLLFYRLPVIRRNLFGGTPPLYAGELLTCMQVNSSPLCRGVSPLYAGERLTCMQVSISPG